MSAFTIDELPLPRDLVTDPGAADFVATTEVRNVCEELGYGTPDVRVSPERLLASWSDPHAPHRLFAARIDGRIVARGMYHRLLDDDAGACWVDVRVLPEHRGRGIGTALAERLESLARADGRSHAIVYIVSPEAPGERLHPPTGSGSLPAGNPEVRFLLARGYRLEQVVRGSRLPLPFDAAELERRLAAARARTGEDYRIRLWNGVTPEPLRDDMAVLLTRMSTDAPQGALDEPEDVWTAERVAEHEQRSTADGTVLLTAAAEHAADGRLVGFTQLAVPPEAFAPADQLDTLVLREHRGHALGMQLKLENLAALQAAHPGRPSVTTWNADENRHMLSVNEELGFVPMGYDGAWKLEL
jgi:GNAT superfamily N-acetyltransferase